MTNLELVRSTLLEEHGDFLKEAVATFAAQLMEAEISAEIGAARGEVSAERSTYRNGYRSRPWETRVGEIELLIPRKRSREAYFPSFLEPRRRAEQAILAVVMEAYVNGVSTRKVDRLVEQLGIHGMSKFSRLASTTAAAACTRPLMSHSRCGMSSFSAPSRSPAEMCAEATWTARYRPSGVEVSVSGRASSAPLAAAQSWRARR